MKKITTYQLLKSATVIKAQTICGDAVEFYTKDFFDWFTEYRNSDMTTEYWSHAPFSQTIVKLYSRPRIDEDRIEMYLGSSSCAAYSYETFFQLNINEINELFTEFAMCSEKAVWTAREMAA